MTLRSKLTARLSENQKQAARRLLYGEQDVENGDDDEIIKDEDGTRRSPANSVAIDKFERQAIAITDLPEQATDGSVDVLGLYSAFRRYRNFERAHLCGEVLLRRDPSVINQVRMARSLIDLNRPADALAHLEDLNVQGLAREAHRQVCYQQAVALRLLGRHDEALELVDGFVRQTPGSIETRLLLIDLLNDQHRHDEVQAHFDEFLRRPDAVRDVIVKHVDWLYGRNRLDELENRLTQLITTRRRAAFLAWRLSRVHWLTGNEAKFSRTTRNSAALVEDELPTPAAISFYSSLFPGHEGWQAPREFQDALKKRLHGDLLPLGLGRSHGPDWALQRLAASTLLENFDFMTEYAEYLIREYPYVPQAYTARAVVQTVFGDYEGAEQNLDKAVVFDRTDPAHYEARFELELLRSGDPERLESILEERDIHVRKFNEYLPDGRQRYYDRDLHTLHKRKGDYVQAFGLHAGQIHNRYLANRYPETYRPQDLDLFGSEKLGDVAVIGQDGVADEIRWAQYLGHLVENSASVSLTCDPRLEGLFRRSFPTLKIRGIRRYPFYFPRVGAENRASVDQIHVSAKVDDELLDELQAADRIVLPEEIAVQRWVANGATRPQIEDDSLNGAYLIPDADLVEAWKSRLQQDCGDRLKVGILWRTEVDTESRQKHCLEIGDFAPLLHPDIKFVSLQPKLRSDEAIACINYDVRVYGDLDLYNDFEAIAACTANLDVVIGLPTVPLELASAVGTDAWVVAPAPFGRYSRADPDGSGRDLMTPNARVYHDLDHEYQIGRRAVLAKVMADVRRDLIGRVSAA